MHIIYNIAGLYRPSGMEKVLIDKANWLVGRGYEVSILTTEQKGRPIAFPLDERIKVYDLDIGYEDNNGGSLWDKIIHYPAKQRKHRRALKSIFKKLKPNITVSMFCNEVNLLPRIKDGSHKVLEVHFSRNKRLLYGRKGIWGLVDRIRSKNEARLVVRYERFIALTNEDRPFWGNIPGICVIPNGIRMPELASDIKRENIVIAVGRYMEQKGLDRLIDAWKIVNDSLGADHGWQLHLVGDGELREALQHQVERLGLNDSVVLCGVAHDMPRVYQSAAILALSSLYEGLPMVLIEAQAYGVPVVSFACQCGPKDVVVDGQTGLLVPEGDINALAEAMLKLIRNPEERERMGRDAARLASRFEFESIMQRWDKLFKEVVREEK